MTSLRSTPGLDPVGNEIRHNFSFLLRRCASAGFPLFPPQRPLYVEGGLGRKKKRARGARWEGEREKRGLFPLPIVPWALSIFPFVLLFFLRYPAGAFAEEREFSAFPKNQHFQIPIQFLVLDIGCNS